MLPSRPSGRWTISAKSASGRSASSARRCASTCRRSSGSAWQKRPSRRTPGAPPAPCSQRRKSPRSTASGRRRRQPGEDLERVRQRRRFFRLERREVGRPEDDLRVAAPQGLGQLAEQERVARQPFAGRRLAGRPAPDPPGAARRPARGRPRSRSRSPRRAPRPAAPRPLRSAPGTGRGRRGAGRLQPAARCGGGSPGPARSRRRRRRRETARETASSGPPERGGPARVAPAAAPAWRGWPRSARGRCPPRPRHRCGRARPAPWPGSAPPVASRPARSAARSARGSPPRP